MRGNGSTDQGEGKMGKHRSRVPTREKFRPEKSSDRKKFRPEKVPTEKSSDRKSSDGKFRPEKVPTRAKGKGKVPSIGQGRYIAILIK